MNYGTDELVAMVMYLGEEMVSVYPDAKIGVGNLSARYGGKTKWHKSHQTGRDVDFLFLAKDKDGHPVHLKAMYRFSADGKASSSAGIVSGVFFDTERNWALVRALMQNPIAEVQYIFVSDDLKQVLIEYAQSVGERRDLIAQASFLLHQPSDSMPHNDHMHVRIYCSAADRSVGCEDFGSLRWTKKDYKYRRPQKHFEREDSLQVEDSQGQDLSSAPISYFDMAK